MSRLKITHLKSGEVIFDSNETPEFMGVRGDLGITYLPHRESLPIVPPQPTHYTDVEWATLLLKDERDHWRHDPHGYEEPVDDSDFDESHDEEESA